MVSEASKGGRAALRPAKPRTHPGLENRETWGTHRYLISVPKTGWLRTGDLGHPPKPYDLLLGRRTYDIFAGYWPNVPADNPIGPVFTKANKYVLTGGSAKL